MLINSSPFLIVTSAAELTDVTTDSVKILKWIGGGTVVYPTKENPNIGTGNWQEVQTNSNGEYDIGYNSSRSTIYCLYYEWSVDDFTNVVDGSSFTLDQITTAAGVISREITLGDASTITITGTTTH